MNSIKNKNMRIKNQPNKNISVDLLYKKPINKNIGVKKNININNSFKKPINKTIGFKKNIYINFSKDNNETGWTIFYIIIIISILFLIIIALFDNYYNYMYNQTIEQPSGVIINQEGAPVNSQISGDMTENKYLTLYGGDDFMKGNQNNYNQNDVNNMNNVNNVNNMNNGYDEYGTYSRYNENSLNFYNDVTKISSNRRELNDYIEKQNNYIKNINNRVRQINNNRMYTPEYAQDKASLAQLRNYERRLANKVNVELKDQPYLADQVNYY